MKYVVLVVQVDLIAKQRNKLIPDNFKMTKTPHKLVSC